jgi:large conductance mechanosensitive channel
MQEHRAPRGVLDIATSPDVDIGCAVPGRHPASNKNQPQPSDKEDAMSIGSDFKEFAMKGNVVDMAVGVIIGGAFGKIVSSLVGDVLMPPIGKMIGGVNFSDLAVKLGTDPAGKDVLIKYGTFLQSVFDFVIIAFVIFMALKGINKLKKPAAAAAPAAPPRNEVLLEEIRDLLKK